MSLTKRVVAIATIVAASTVGAVGVANAAEPGGGSSVDAGGLHLGGVVGDLLDLIHGLL